MNGSLGHKFRGREIKCITLLSVLLYGGGEKGDDCMEMMVWIQI